jgi:outer membrane autotransporter protein
MFRHSIAAAAALGGCVLASEARAQSYVNPNPGGATVVSATQFDSLSFTAPTLITVQQSLSVTQLIGRLNHGAILYDRTFNASFNTPMVQAGVTAAIAAITSAGGPGVVITGPTLVSHVVTTGSSSTSVYSLNPASQDPVTHRPQASQFVITTTSVFGPTTIGAFVPIPGGGTNPNAGVLGRCNVDTLPSVTRPVCTPVDPGVLTVLPGQLDINVNTEVIYLIDTTTTTTMTTTTTEVYDLDGMTVRGIGTVHAAGAEAGFDQADRFARRLVDAGLDAGPGEAWAEAYGYRVRSGSAGDFPGDRRHGYGVDGGFGHAFGETVRLGAAFDYGTSRIGEASAGEQARLRLAQIGLHGAWRSGPVHASLAATYGWGRISAQVTPTGLTATASSRYPVRTAGASAEAGYRIAAPGFVLTPALGAAYEHVRAGSFTETGSLLALDGRARSYDRYKGWLGLSAETEGGSPLVLRAYGRVVAFGGDRRVDVPVTFTGSTTLLSIAGPDTGRFGGDLGAALVWHLGARVDAYGAYDARLRSHYSAQTGSVGLRIGL